MSNDDRSRRNPSIPEGVRVLPEGWKWAKLSDVTVPVPNVNPEEEPDKVFRYADISAVDNERHGITELREFVGSNAPSRARRPVQVGDVLFSNVRTYLRNI